MNASHDRPYAPNIDARVFWLGQVSEAATALTGTRVPAQLNRTEASKLSAEPVVNPKFRSLFARLDDSFDPNVRLGAPNVRRNLRFSKVSGLLIILGLSAVLIAQFTGPAIWQQLITDSQRAVRLASSSGLAISIEPAESRLVVQQSRAARGEPAPLGLTLRGPAEGAVVRITELAPGMELSAGRADGLDGWEVPANDLGYVWIAPPDTFAGSVDLIAELRGPDGKVADRQTITLNWTSPNAPVLGHDAESSILMSVSPKPVQLRSDQNDRTEAALVEPDIPQHTIGGEEIAPGPPISLAPIQLQSDREAVRPEAPLRTLNPLEARWKEIGAASSTLLEAVQLRPDSKQMVPAELSDPPLHKQPSGEELAVLLQRGKELIATGDLAAARMVLRKAVEANNAEAALALGATYDPLVLRQLRVYGITPDAAMARSWYEKAAELGSSAATRRLEMLTEGMSAR
jgi:hypothetical protein